MDSYVHQRSVQTDQHNRAQRSNHPHIQTYHDRTPQTGQPMMHHNSHSHRQSHPTLSRNIRAYQNGQLRLEPVLRWCRTGSGATLGVTMIDAADIESHGERDIMVDPKQVKLEKRKKKRASKKGKGERKVKHSREQRPTAPAYQNARIYHGDANIFRGAPGWMQTSPTRWVHDFDEERQFFGLHVSPKQAGVYPEMEMEMEGEKLTPGQSAASGLSVVGREVSSDIECGGSVEEDVEMMANIRDIEALMRRCSVVQENEVMMSMD